MLAGGLVSCPTLEGSLTTKLTHLIWAMASGSTRQQIFLRSRRDILRNPACAWSLPHSGSPIPGGDHVTGKGAQELGSVGYSPRAIEASCVLDTLASSPRVIAIGFRA